MTSFFCVKANIIVDQLLHHTPHDFFAQFLIVCKNAAGVSAAATPKISRILWFNVNTFDGKWQQHQQPFHVEKIVLQVQATTALRTTIDCPIKIQLFFFYFGANEKWIFRSVCFAYLSISKRLFLKCYLHRITYDIALKICYI